MKNLIATFLVLCITVFPIASFGQSSKKISYVNENQQAPFAGFLLSPEAYSDMKFSFEEDGSLFKLKLNYEIQKQVLPWKLKYENEKAFNNSYVTMCEDRLESKNKTIKFYEEELTKEMEPNFWEQIDFGTGLAIGVAITIVGIIAADKLDDNFIED